MSSIYIRSPEYLASSSAIKSASEALSSIKARSTKKDKPHIVAGQEIRVVLSHIINGTTPITDNLFWKTKFKNILARPAVEPIAMLSASRFRSDCISFKWEKTLIVSLCGKEVDYRTGNIYGVSRLEQVRFEDLGEASLWTHDICAAFTNKEMRPLFPAYCFLRTICAHPYNDGNGRLARMLAQLAMMRESGLEVPIVPLAPIMYVHASAIASSIIRASRQNLFEEFSSTFYAAIQDRQFEGLDV